MLATALAVAAPAEAGKLFKWVDEQGHVRYGDRIPPQYAGQRQQTLNPQGVVVETRAAAKTQEQLAQERRAAERAAEEERLRRDRARHDHMLLSTFSTEDDMVLTRDGKIAAIDAAVRLAKARLEKAHLRLTALTRRAANMERSGKTVPTNLRKQIVDTRELIAQNEEYVKNQRNEQGKIRRRFEVDLKRFHELKTRQMRLETADSDPLSSPPDQGTHTLVGK
jgi:multidrug efflux pump subunit AcrA (membrane-fusion protein)